MEIQTTRFGTLAMGPDDVLRFPAGLRGLEGCLDWVLLADAHNDALGWLQSTSRGEIALAVVDPRRFVPGHQVRVMARELAPLALDAIEKAYVLVVVGKNEHGITVNLKAPLIINLERRLGHQVVVTGDQPLQYELCRDRSLWKKTA